MVGYLQQAHDINVGFGQWMLVGVPMSVIFMVMAWYVLTFVIFIPGTTEIPGGRKLISDVYKKPGRMNMGGKLVPLIFVLAAAFWTTVPLLWRGTSIEDAVIAMCVAVALSAQFAETGLSKWVGEQVGGLGLRARLPTGQPGASSRSSCRRL